MKKFVAILMALIMVLAVSSAALAAETFQLTITGIKDHTYKVYQIYTGDVAEEGDTPVLSNVKYGKNHYPAVDGAVGDPVPNTELQNLMNSQDPAAYFNTQIKDEAYATVNPDGTETSKVIEVEAGYYMIVDVTADLPDGQTKSTTILKVAENTTVVSKHATISSTKKVDDKNDSTTDENEVAWQDSADYDIGDDVPFQLTVTLPSTLATYDTYELTFHDKQGAGFDAPKNFKVYIQRGNDKLFDLTAEADYVVSNSCTKPDTCEYSGCTFTVTVKDVKRIYTNDVPFQDGDILIVEYTAKLNDTANVGRAGNENSMYVCHPDGHTPKDAVTVLTYGLTVNKIDGTTKNALEGAGFTLQKWNEAEGEGKWQNVGVEKVGGDITSFTWSGIDGGKYKLVETTTPDGYNTIADIEFTIDATHKDTWLADGNYALEDVIAKDPSGTAAVFADKNADGQLDGKLEGNIENHKGVVLPETGAKGTVVLIGCSSLAVIMAAVFMITRKKMSVYED